MDMTPIEDEILELSDKEQSLEHSIKPNQSLIMKNDPEFLSRLNKLNEVQDMYRKMEVM